MVRVLVIEDEPLIGWMIADWLCDQGHVVVGPTQTCPAALQIIAEERLDLAIVDYVLGNDNARRVIGELKQQCIPFLFVTADWVRGDIEFSGIEILSKPIEFERLKETLERLLTSPVVRLTRDGLATADCV